MDKDTINSIAGLTMAYVHLVAELNDADVISSEIIAKKLESQANDTATNAPTKALFHSIAKALRSSPDEREKILMH